VTIAFAHHDGLDIAYETDGAPDGEPMIMIMGLSAQLVAWPEGFCAALVEQGFQLARYDHRDSGQSTHLTDAGVPGWRSLRSGAGAPYSLADMAGDALAVMDSLGWQSAHVVGLSMGGMIAQILATRHPDRVRSLTSLLATPAANIGLITPLTMWRMGRLSRRLGQPRNAHEAGRNNVEFCRLTASPGYPLDEDIEYEIGRRSYERDPDPMTGGTRQNAAIRASGDRRAELASVRVPTLVIHGDSDVVIRPSGGRATAKAIPGARLVIYPGMGHELPRPLWPAITREIRAIADRAPRPAAPPTGEAPR
jgi:pimeloyl-ACP methyl ester carboxylesterase